MQNTLTSVALCFAPSVISPAATPVSVIFVAVASWKAPLLRCSQLVNGAFVQSLSAPHRCGGFSKSAVDGLRQAGQKTFAFPFPVPVEKEVLVAGAAGSDFRLKPIGSP